MGVQEDIKIPAPMEQLAIQSLGFPLGFQAYIKNHHGRRRRHHHHHHHHDHDHDHPHPPHPPHHPHHNHHNLVR